MQVTATSSQNNYPSKANWGGVIAISLGAFIIIALEFLPLSLLTPMAEDLQITEGYAGQTLSISGFFAMATSLFISSLMGRSDRRKSVLFFSLLMVISACIVTFAPTPAVLMIGRALVGVSVGGFWSISAATVMRLVPQDLFPKAIAILNGGNALATTFAAPLGSFLGNIIGWRGAFFCLVPLAIITLLWQRKLLPPMPITEVSNQSFFSAFKLLKRKHVLLGMISMALYFGGQFMLFTYLRPFLETITNVTPQELTLILLGIGIAGFLGTVIIGNLLKNRLYSLLIPIAIFLSLISISLIYYGQNFIVSTSLLVLWGLLTTAAPVAWWTWLSRALPDDAETGGGLLVGIVQMAIMVGSAIGGWLYDHWGYQSTFYGAAVLLMLGATAIFFTWKSETKQLSGAVIETKSCSTECACC